MTSEILNLSALCRCCHSNGEYKSLGATYTYKNGLEVYKDMLLDTLNVKIEPPPIEASYSICEECIVRLRDASKFKREVLECERKFEEYCKNELAEVIKMEFESSDDGHDYEDTGDESKYIENKLEIDIELAKSEDKLKAEKEGSQDGAKLEIKIEEDKSELGIKKEDKNKSRISTAKKKKKNNRKSNTENANQKIKYDSSLEVHVKTDNGILYSCKICQGSYTKHTDMIRHIKSMHTERQLFKCEYCEKTFSNKYTRHAHTMLHKKIHTCNICGKVYTTKSTLREHLNIHSKLFYKCDLCLKEFHHKTSIVVHMKKHMGLSKKIVCDQCGRCFNDLSNLKIHKNTVHEKLRPYACEQCPKTFTAKKHLVIHIRKHSGDKPFECADCKCCFYTNFERNRHSCFNKSPPHRKYTCKICMEVFLERGSYARHIRRSHAGQKPHECSVCGKDFTCKFSMKRHEMLHSGVKPFSCEQCPLKFSQKTMLVRHIARLHSGPKNLRQEQCELCNKLVVNLKQHLKCHNDRRFVCTLCDKSYSLASALNRHKKSTHFGFAVQCDLCPKRYVTVKSLKRHRLKTHKIPLKSDDFEHSVPEYSILNSKDGDSKIEPIDDDD